MIEFTEKELSEYLKKISYVSRDQLVKYPVASKKNIKQYTKKLLNKVFRGKKTDRFFWPNAMLAIGLEYSHRATDNTKDLEVLIEYYDNWIEKGTKINHLDNLMNGYSMIYLYEETGNPKYKKELDKLVDYLHMYPKDDLGSFPYRVYKDGKKSDVFIDALGMICPFLCRYGNITNNEELIEIAISQLNNFLEYGFDQDKKLPYHSYNIENYIKSGIIGWGRAIGWILIGLIDSLEYINEQNNNYNYLLNAFVSLIDTAILYQSEEGYFSWQLEAREGPVDTSATSMIAYSIAKGLDLGILDKDYKPYLKKSISALYHSTKNGYIMDSSAECRGLSMYPQSYGWYPWSQGLTLALISLSLKLDL